jgi:hypothetical protein
MREAICRIRTALEVEREEPDKLCYIGGPAIQHRLRQEDWDAVPSVSTIESVLRQAGLTHPQPISAPVDIVYPALQPDAPQELIEVDIVPHRLPGGATIACFNAIDVVSRNVSGVQHSDKRAATAVDVLVQLWQALGVPRYTQVDNESCFSGGFTHPYVIGQVAKLALLVGTELVFTPFYHPESNGAIERFHQDYNQHVWDKHYLTDLLSVQAASNSFFAHYRHSGHIRRLSMSTPAERHRDGVGRTLPAEWVPPSPLPLMSGHLHFIRAVTHQQQIRLLNVDWNVDAQPETGVWATLSLTPKHSTLRVYNQAPYIRHRRCLATHLFPVAEPVVASSQSPELHIDHRLPSWVTWFQKPAKAFLPPSAFNSFSTMSSRLFGC